MTGVDCRQNVSRMRGGTIYNIFATAKHNKTPAKQGFGYWGKMSCSSNPMCRAQVLFLNNSKPGLAYLNLVQA